MAPTVTAHTDKTSRRHHYLGSRSATTIRHQADKPEPPICSVLHYVFTVGVGLITVFLAFMSIRSRTVLAGVGGSASQTWGMVLGVSGGMRRA
jgi:hypothetical protein